MMTQSFASPTDFQAHRIRIYESHARDDYKRVVGMAYGMLGNLGEAEDAAQETFIRAWRHLGQYDGEHPFRCWLAAITRNLVLDHMRRRKARTTLSLDLFAGAGLERLYAAVPSDEQATNPEKLVLSRELDETFRTVVDSLPPRYQEIVTLHDFDGLSYSEIASVLQCPLGTVRSRLHRGRALVRRQLHEDHPAFLPV